MARRRALYGAALLAALLFQIFDVGYLAHFLLGAVLVLPLVSLLLTLPLLGCRVEVLASPAAVERGEPAAFRAALRGRCWLPVSRAVLRLELKNALTGEEERRRVVLSGLLGGEGLACPLEAPTGRCGRLTCQVRRVRLLDGLGLFALPLRAAPPAALLVLPRTEPFPLPERWTEGDHGGPLLPRPGGGPGEDYDLRGYRPGDPLRSVHWKLSSKRDELVVRETLEPRRRELVVSFPHFGPAEEVERTLDRLNSCCRALLEAGRPHRVRWAHPETGAVRDFRVEDPRGLERCLEAVLSDPAPETGQDLPETSAAGEQRVRLGPEGEVVP